MTRTKTTILASTALAVIALVFSATPAAADQCFADDVIVDGSECVGFDCVCNMTFGFDTIVLQENNLRIFFNDTSSAASFPDNDWRLVANDSANGGREHFSIEDASAGRLVFTVEAGARANALVVDSSSRIGIGTASPSVELHVVDGDTPTLRLEQNSSSGFTPQTWDVAGNETNFFVRDVTNGSKLPLRIRPNTPTSAIDMFSDRIEINGGSANLDVRIESDSDANLFYTDAGNSRIGVGTSTPDSLFHIFGTGDIFAGMGETPATSGGIGLSFGFSPAAGGGFFNTRSGGASNLLLGAGDLTRINIQGGTGFIGFGSNVAAFAPGAPLVHQDTGANLSAAGVWTNGSSRSIKHDIRDLSADDALQAFRALAPVTYLSNLEEDEQYVGFIAEDVPDLVAMGDRKTLATMDVVAVLTKVVQEQDKTIAALLEEVEQLREVVQGN